MPNDRGTTGDRTSRYLTGKTWFIGQQVARAAERYGSEHVMVTSLTRAAAHEAAGRGMAIPRQNIGTLHHFGYIALGRPEMAETPEGIKAWNEAVRANGWNGRLLLTPPDDKPDLDDFTPERGSDSVLERVALYRAQMKPRVVWTPEALAFDKYWEQWKLETNRADFADLIDLAYNEPCPVDARSMFVDEAQDMSALEMRLVRKWAEAADTLTVVGDSDQAIFTWRGADPTVMWTPPIPSRYTRVLGQSYRVPREVHAAAQSWIRQMGDRREDVTYLPRDDDGLARRHQSSYRHPEQLIEESVIHALGGQTVMILASCGHMLEPTKAILKRKGIPFANPYRRRRADWNPLYAPAGRVRTADRILSYLAPRPEVSAHYWTPGDIWRWCEWLDAERTMTHGAKAEIKRVVASDDPLESVDLLASDLQRWFTSEAVAAAYRGDLAWWRDHLLESHQRKVDYPLRVLEAFGPQALRDEPRVLLGTIHCSPPDEPVLTANRGYVPIGALDPMFDRVVSYMAGSNRQMPGTRKASQFERSVRDYSGPLITLTTARSRTRVTPNHRLRVRFDPDAQGKYVVYLMRRGTWWRVGISRAPRTGVAASVGANHRLSSERGDGAWILALCEDRQAALVREAIISATYGIPQLSFEVRQEGRSFTNEELRIIHEEANLGVLPRVFQLATKFGIDLTSPIWTGDGTVRAGYAFETVAANAIPGLMLLPVWRRDNITPEWLPFGVERNQYDGPVYGLHVIPHEHYVSGGAIVHNSVKGGEADVVAVFPDLSEEGDRAYVTSEAGRDAVSRLFYVAMTRSRDELYLCRGSGGPAVSWAAAALG